MSHVGQTQRAMDELDLLLVQIGQRQFVLTLAEVRHIVPLPQDFQFSGNRAVAYLPFDGEPLRFVSGWDVMGEPSYYQELVELQPMLPQRRQDHIDWMSALEMSIHGGTPFSKARDPHQCAFGKWYYSYQPKDASLSCLLSSFERPHAHIHGLADRLLKMTEAGHHQEAIAQFETARKTTLADLLELFDSADQLLGELQRRIAIILENEDARCALGVDLVLDIVRVAGERVTMEICHGESFPRLVRLADERIVPFFPWEERGAKLGEVAPENVASQGADRLEVAVLVS